jgi:antitoxin (DNA-binding transcriptional repressor) of toxin-antitoxin stability system
MTIVDADNVAADLATYLKKVAAGESFVIAVDDKPVAELRPTKVGSAKPRPIGLCAGEFVVPDDFDAPLPDDIIADFEGR